MQYIRAKKLAQKLDVNVSTIWRWRKKNAFPEPIYLGPNTVVWSTKSIEDWMSSKYREVK